MLGALSLCDSKSSRALGHLQQHRGDAQLSGSPTGGFCRNEMQLGSAASRVHAVLTELLDKPLII